MTLSRASDIELAQKYGLSETVRAIDGGGDFLEIMYTFSKEVGIDRAIEILKEEENPKWVYLFTYNNINKISEKQLGILCGVICRATAVSKQAKWAYWFALYIKITDKQFDDLWNTISETCTAEQKLQYARMFLFHTVELPLRQRKKIRAVINN